MGSNNLKMVDGSDTLDVTIVAISVNADISNFAAVLHKPDVVWETVQIKIGIV